MFRKTSLLALVLSPAIALAQAAQPVPAEAAPAAAPAPAPTAAPAPAKPAIDAKVGLMVQGWFWATDDNRFSFGQNVTPPANGLAPGKGDSTFRIRRAELSFGGKVNKVIEFNAMIDPSISSGPILQDAFVGALLPNTTVRLGQFKLPLTMEGYGSSSALLFAERAIVTRTLGDKRDLGLMVLSRDLPFVEYEAAVVNGSGKNTTDPTPQKGGVGRLVLKPVKGVSFGGSGYYSQSYDPKTNEYFRQTRAGGEVAVDLAGVTANAEYVEGRDEQATYTAKPFGWYGVLGYRLGQVQAVARYERFESDKGLSRAECRVAGATASRCLKNAAFTAGVNYYLPAEIYGGAKLQLNYVRGRDEVAERSSNEVVLVAQVKI